MITYGTPTASELDETRRAAEERAIRAWTGFSHEAKEPEHVEMLKPPRREGKSVVVGLGPVGPRGMHVVAKELVDGAAETEMAVYRHVLPELSVRGPELIGCAESSRAGRSWLFLEAVTASRFDKGNPNHLATATLWVAALHAETASDSFASILGGREPDHYMSVMSTAVSELDAVSRNQVLKGDHRRLLNDISALLEKVLESSDRLTEEYSTFPESVVHGDYKGNNMAFSIVDGSLELRVFDWSEAHWGPMAVDVWSIDRGLYRAALESRSLAHDSGTIEQWARFGSALRWVMAISWEIPRLMYDSVERPMRRMALYERRLRAALEGSPWVS